MGSGRYLRRQRLADRPPRRTDDAAQHRPQNAPGSLPSHVFAHERPNPDSVGPFHRRRKAEHRGAADSERTDAEGGREGEVIFARATLFGRKHGDTKTQRHRECAHQFVCPLCLCVFVSLCLVLCASCNRSESSPTKEIVLYSSIDEPYLKPLLKKFEEQSQIHVRVVTDTEATKSAGLAEKIEAEKAHPQADVYWGNEIFHTNSLAERGI